MGSQRIRHDWTTELNWKLQYFGHLMQRSDSLEKTLMLGKVEGKRRRGQQRMRWLACTTNSMDMNLSRLQVIVKDRDVWHAAVHGVTKSWTQLSNWTITVSFCFANSIFPLYPQWAILCAPPDRSNLWFSSSYKNPMKYVLVTTLLHAGDWSPVQFDLKCQHTTENPLFMLAL